jgi:hypothetical protein
LAGGRTSISREDDYAVRDPFIIWGFLATSRVSMLFLLVPRHLGVLHTGFSACVALQPFVVAVIKGKDSAGITASR